MKFPSRQGSAKAGESRNPVGFWGVPGWLDFYGMKSQHEEKQEILGIEIQVHLVRVKSPKIWKKISYQSFSRWNVLYFPTLIRGMRFFVSWGGSNWPTRFPSTKEVSSWSG